ncbi:MAG: hypothetical protein IJW98_04265 [Clostridia bacterium]|nr:hypothetical protein [Clostridia bacterium]
MNEALHSLKSEIISHLLAVEQMQIGTARRQAKGIAIGSPAYYQLFSPLYESDPALFARAIGALCNPDDVIYQEFAKEISNLYDYDHRRIVLHALRLSLYYDIDRDTVPKQLKELLHYAAKLQESHSFEVYDSGARLFLATYNLLESAISDPQHPNAQATLSGDSVRELFAGFFTTAEVTDPHTAMVYELCYRHKAVAKCPAYVRKAVKVLGVYDRLYGIGWQMVLEKKSAKSVEGGIQLLEEVGFTELVGLLRKARDYKAAHPNAKQYPNPLSKAILELITPEHLEQTVREYIAACKE